MGGKQKKLVPISENVRHPIQQSREIGGHAYSMICGSAMNKHVVGCHSKFFKLNRLDEISTRFYNSREDRLGFFHNLETVQKFTSDEEEKSCLTAKGIKSIIKKKKPPDSSEESDDTEKVHKLNKENAEKASPFFVQRSFPKSLSHELKEKSVASHWKPPLQKAAEKSQAEDNAKETHNKQSGQDTKGLGKKNEECGASSGLGKDIEGTDSSSDKERKALETTPESEDTSEDVGPSKSQDQDVEHKDCGKTLFLLEDEQSTSNDSPPPPAPFDHRIVSAKRMGINSYYHVYKGEVLGGGRFGQVHKCEEKSTGIQLAAKIIKARNIKEKDEVKNEINVMNQLDHVNLIQLYDAFESKNDIVLVMEYVQGGELFDRIIDENCNLTEIDTILFTKQICEGIQYMHRMYILHLDLKPENILCVNREANQIKIIDFGLARRYKPREKLKVNFGTPEFLAPEVVNYDFVSFPTDMWSVGVIAYMLLSGLSPFLGEDDNETLNNILACRWDFEDEEFANVSEDAKDFITKLLIKEKGWRISATAALKHPWLSDQKLHGRLLTQKKAKNSSTSQALEAP